MTQTAIQMPALNLSVAEIARRTGGTIVSGPASSAASDTLLVANIAIDSRDVTANSLFVALPGSRADGHEFVIAAAQAGACAALVTHAVDNATCAQIIVDDCLQALSDLATMARLNQQMNGGRLVGITGSVGKTGSKEMLAHLLRKFTTCHANKSSYNNNIGVPLTLANLADTTPVAVQEMGMNAPGEIADLTLIAGPDIAIITRIADSHAGYFDSLAEIAAAKAEIFDGLGGDAVAILNRDDAFFDDLSRRAQFAGAQRIIGFGRHEDAEFRLVEVITGKNGVTVTADIAGSPITFTLGMHAPHWAMNALAVLAAVDALGFDRDEAASHLADFADLAGRGAISQGQFADATITLIDDSYNASPASMAAGLAGLSPDGAQIMVLSDMRELGDGTAAAHAALVPLITDMAPRIVIAIGEAMQAITPGLTAAITCHNAADPDDAIAYLRSHVKTGDRIFIKGSLGSGAWRVAKAVLTDFAASTDGEAPHAA